MKKSLLVTADHELSLVGCAPHSLGLGTHQPADRYLGCMAESSRYELIVGVDVPSSVQLDEHT